MDLPKFHDIFIPILDILSNGKICRHNELCQRVRNKYYSDLTQELLNKKTKTGANVLLDRIGWAKTYLKQGKFSNKVAGKTFGCWLSGIFAVRGCLKTTL